jgi:hypothetical protein
MTSELEISENKSLDPVNNPAAFDHAYKIAKVFADSDIVPKHFQGKAQNVFVALCMARNLKLDPMLALQNIYVVNGTPSLSSQMLIGLVNSSGLIEGSIVFESNNKTLEDLVITAKCKLKSGEIASVSYAYANAKAAGLTVKPPWKAAPEQMMRYRAAAFLCRSYFPQVALGLITKEEAEEIPATEAPTDRLIAALANPVRDVFTPTPINISDVPEKHGISDAVIEPQPEEKKPRKRKESPAEPTPVDASTHTSASASKLPPGFLDSDGDSGFVDI